MPSKCPGCGGFSSLAEPGNPEARRCQTCGRLYVPSPGEPATLPPAPVPTERPREEVDAMVAALIESGDIVKDGRTYILDGVRLGTSVRRAKDAVYLDAALSDVCAAIVASDVQGAAEDADAATGQQDAAEGEPVAEGEPEDAPEE